MYCIYATIELINQHDEYKSQDVKVVSPDIRRWSGEVLVDTSAIGLSINEEIKKYLGLRNGEMISVALANGSIIKREMIGDLKIRFGNRFCYTRAFVLPGNTEPLMGRIHLAGMDLVINPNENKLEYNHKEYEGGFYHLKGFSHKRIK
jgi:clan AA aspartic protease